MQNVLPKTLVILLIVAAFAIFPSQSIASQLSLIFPIPTVTIPPMPNSLPIQSTTTYTQSTSVHITISDTPQTSTQTILVSPTPTRIPFPTAPSAQSLQQLILSRLTPSPSAKLFPTATPRPTITPTKSPSPTTSQIQTNPTPTEKLTTTPTPTSADTIRDYLMNGINNYRHSLGLTTVQISDQTCSFAKIRAKEISTDFSHTGFENRIASHTIPYTSWTLITENIAMTSNYKDVVNMWINSPGHAANMQKDTPYVCVENYGNYYAYEGMRP